MLGSVSEAEDVVQEAFYRYGRVDPAEVEAPRAFLTTTPAGHRRPHSSSRRSVANQSPSQRAWAGHDAL